MIYTVSYKRVSGPKMLKVAGQKHALMTIEELSCGNEKYTRCKIDRAFTLPLPSVCRALLTVLPKQET